MSKQPTGPLQHPSDYKDKLTDKIQGVITTICKLPQVIHADSSKEVAAAIKELAARERVVVSTKEAVTSLPQDLSAYDQTLDDALLRASELEQSIRIVEAFLAPSSSSSSSSSTRGPRAS